MPEYVALVRQDKPRHVILSQLVEGKNPQEARKNVRIQKGRIPKGVKYTILVIPMTPR